MKETIRSILDLIDKGRFKNESHVRFSLVARICEKLNWDIWNPYVFDTEDPTVKFVTTDDGKGTKGKIDIVLYKANKNTRIDHIYIEVKKLGLLTDNNIEKYRNQLEKYSLKKSPPLSVLTDGLRWEFFLNSLETTNGKYSERLINSFILSEEDIEAKCMIIESLMHSSVTMTSVKTLGKKMRKDYEIINFIQDVKQQAINLHPDDLLKQIFAAKDMINRVHTKHIDHKKIGELWNTKLALGGLIPKSKEGSKGPRFSTGVRIDQIPTYAGKAIVEISIRHQDVIQINGLASLKKAVYDFVIQVNPKYTPRGTGASIRIQESSSNLRKPIHLQDGRFAEGALSSDETVKQCRKALEEAGFSANDLVIGYK